MIDWIERARLSQKGRRPTAKTDETPVSSVSSAGVSRIGEKHDSSITAVGPDRGTWTDAEIATFTDRRARLRRWGWPESEAEALAERLTQRDRESDERRACVECRRCQPPGLICTTHRVAGVGRELGHDLATRLQRCPAYAPVTNRQATTRGGCSDPARDDSR